MKHLFLSLSILLSCLVASGQTTTSANNSGDVIVEQPKFRVADSDAKIEKVTITNEFTIVEMSYTNKGKQKNSNHINIDKRATIFVEGKKYAFVKAEGIAYSPQKTVVKYKRKADFILYFKPIPKDTKSFSLIEHETSQWKFYIELTAQRNAGVFKSPLPSPEDVFMYKVFSITPCEIGKDGAYHGKTIFHTNDRRIVASNGQIWVENKTDSSKTVYDICDWDFYGEDKLMYTATQLDDTIMIMVDRLETGSYTFAIANDKEKKATVYNASFIDPEGNSYYTATGVLKKYTIAPDDVVKVVACYRRGAADTKIRKVIMTNDYTIVEMSWLNERYFDGYVNIDREAAIYAKNNKYKLLKTEGIAFAPERTNVEFKQTAVFRLYFEPMPKKTISFDLIENEKGWQFQGVYLKDEDDYSVWACGYKAGPDDVVTTPASYWASASKARIGKIIISNKYTVVEMIYTNRDSRIDRISIDKNAEINVNGKPYKIIKIDGMKFAPDWTNVTDEEIVIGLYFEPIPKDTRDFHLFLKEASAWRFNSIFLNEPNNSFDDSQNPESVIKFYRIGPDDVLDKSPKYKSDNPNVKIERVILSKVYTIVDMSIIPNAGTDSVNFDPRAALYANGRRYALFKAEGVAHAPKKTAVQQNHKINIRLYFIPMPKDTKMFDLVENETSEKNVHNIVIKREDFPEPETIEEDIFEEEEIYIHKVISITPCTIDENGKVHQGKTNKIKSDQTIILTGKKITIIDKDKQTIVAYNIQNHQINNDHILFETIHSLSGDNVMVKLEKFENKMYRFAFFDKENVVNVYIVKLVDE